MLDLFSFWSRALLGFYSSGCGASCSLCHPVCARAEHALASWSSKSNVWAARTITAFAIEHALGIADNMYITSHYTRHVQQDFYCSKPSVV